MSRWKASAIHLGISILIGLLVALLLFGVWYPPPYFSAGGADKLVLLLVGIDLSLGPLLTLAVFKSGKWGLKFDLAVIGALQIGALVYGLSIICESRPVFLVGAYDRYNLVAANSIDDADLAQGSKEEFRRLSWTGPVLVGTKRPDSEDERFNLMVSGAVGRDVQVQPKYYVDYKEAVAGLLAHAKSIDELRKKTTDVGRSLLASALQSLKRDEADLVWLPIVARKSDLAMLIDRKTGEPLEAVALDPW